MARIQIEIEDSRFDGIETAEIEDVVKEMLNVGILRPDDPTVSDFSVAVCDERL